jgi:hypothetical protein
MNMTMTPTVSRPHTGRVADDPDPEVPARAQRRRYSVAYKQRILTEYEAADRAGKAAVLRREGLYTSLISAWREQHSRDWWANNGYRRSTSGISQAGKRKSGFAPAS